MVDALQRFPLGSISGRNIFSFAASLLVAIFALLFAIAPTAHAADATWQGSAISYSGKQFIKAPDASSGDARGLPQGTVIYAFVEPAPNGSASPVQKAHLIYFPPGTDATKATAATYVTYDYTPPGTYANASAAVSITLDPQGSTTNTGTTSCAVEGIGWIICPVANFLAGAMDKIFEALANFLTVRPVQTTQDNALFRMWSVMRNFANVAFVGAFLIIIYSQVTGFGISSYGIKRLLPRLIAAAILVNISYWICAIAIDVSNISGHSLQQLFINLRNTMVGAEGNSWENLGSWQSWTGFILSGGTAALAAGIGIQALLAGSVTGSIMLLLPILVIVLTSALVALLIMALRQAFITILVILSPLAFVAYLLPNTEKYFEKWRDLFMTMLLMFPIISVIFGGAQLAGMAIIQNANSINLVILGMAVQVAPLIITPLLIKFSGALLTRFAGVLNNPNKGLIDRTRNWAKDRAENQKAHVLGKTPREGWRGAATRRTQNIERKRREREGWRAANQAKSDAKWAGTQAYSDIEQAVQEANLAKQTGETAAQARFEGAKSTNADIQQLDVNARAAKLRLDVSQARAEANWEEMKAGDARSMVVPDNMPVNALANYAHLRQAQARSIFEESVNAAVESRRAHSAEHVRKKANTDLMLKDAVLRERAGGIDPHGADSALANAVAEERTAFAKSVEEAKHVLKHFNVGADDRATLLKGEKPITVEDSSGHKRTFTLEDTFATEAAIEIQMKEGSFGQKEAIIAESGKGGKLYAHRTTIGDEAGANKLSEQAAYLGGSTLNRIKQGEITGEDGLNEAAAYSIATGKLRAEHLANMDYAAVERILEVARTNNTKGLKPEFLPKFTKNIPRLGTLANEALENKNLSGRVAENSLPHLEDMRRLWPPDLNANNSNTP